MKPFALLASTLLLGALALPLLGQQSSTEPQPRPQRRSTPAPSSEPAAAPATTTEPEAATPRAARQSESERPQPSRATESERSEPSQQGGAGGAANTNFHFDMKETPANVTHHEVTVNGHILHYTATAGRMPIKNGEGVTEALMFYVAYTVDGSEAGKRPLTFSYNGGPGSASLWLHIGALGPRTVVMQSEGWMPQPPFRLHDNPYTPLDKTDIVMIDAIGTGWSRH